ncbi:MAG: MATE family efflux transporter [Acetatifactor sp.]
MGRRQFYSLTFKTVIPLMLQSLLTSSVNFIDQIMVGKLGVSEIAAIGVANKIYSLFYLVLYGTCCALVMFVSQYCGKKDVEGVRKVTGMTCLITVSLGIFVTIATSLFPRTCLSLFTDDISVIEAGIGYLRTISASYLLLSFIYPINYLLRGQTRVRIALVTAIGSVFMNIFANYAFIFGHFGMPRLNVVGAAIGTVATRTVELTILIIYLVVSRNEVLLDLKGLFRFRIQEMVVFLKKAVPLATNEFLWGVGTSVYLVVYGHMGTEELAAMSIMSTLQTMVQTFGLSLSSSAAVIVGNEIGKGDRDSVFLCGKRFHRLAVGVGILVGTVLFALISPIVTAYSIKGTRTGILLAQCLTIMCCYLPFSCYNSMNIEGLFRSGGDIKYVLIMDTGSIWLIGMPLTALLGYVCEFPLIITFLAYVAVEVYKLIIGTLRYRSGKWLHRLSLEG